MFNVIKLLISVPFFFITHFTRYWSLKRNFTQEKLDKFVADFCDGHLKAIGVTYEIIDKRSHIPESSLYISNHNSMYDSMLTAQAINTKLSYFVAGEYNVFIKLPIIKPIVNWLNLIFVDRSNLRSGFEAVKLGTEQLKQGNNLVIFAEGEISKYVIKADQEYIADFHAGSFKPAQLAKKPVTPITVIGSDKVHNTLKMFSPIKSGHVKIIIDEPIYFHEREEKVMTTDMAEETRQVILNNYISALKDEVN